MFRTVLMSLALIGLFSIVDLSAQPYIDWKKAYGGSAEEVPEDVEQTSDGGFIVTGSARSEDGDVSEDLGLTDFWVVKLDIEGAIEWEKSFGGTFHEVAHDVEETTDGGYIVAGYTCSEDGQITNHLGLDDFWVIKLDSLGTMQWQRTYGGSDNDFAYAIQQTSDGGYIVGGGSRSTNGDVTGNHGDYDFWVVKLNSDGDIEWEQSLGGSRDEFLYSLQQTSDEGYILAGKTKSYDGDVTGFHGGNFEHDYWVVKLSPTGEIEWEKALGSTGHEVTRSVIQTNDGGYMVAGFTTGSIDGDITSNNGAWDAWIVKLDAEGEIEWEKSLGSYHDDYAHEIRQTTDGGYILAGCTEYIPGSHGSKDFLAMKLTSTGEIDWQAAYGGTAFDRAYSVRQTNDDGFIIAGFTESNNGDVSGNNGDIDFFLVKLGPCGVNPGLEIDDDFVIQSMDVALSTTHQWINCGDGSIIEGVEGSAFAPEDGGDYSVIVSNGACIDTSDCVYLCPLDTDLAVGSDIIVSYQDTAMANFQWIDCSTGNPIEGAVDFFYEPEVNGEYAVIITEENCSVTSACRVVCPETINTEVMVFAGTIQSLEDTLSATFQWVDCNSNIPIEGQTGHSFTPTISGEYAVIISRGVCSETSDCVTICLIDANIIATDDTIQALADPEYSTFQWIDCTSGSVVAGETSQTFTPSTSGDYAVMINQANCVESSDCVTMCVIDPEIIAIGNSIHAQADTLTSTFQWIDCTDGSPIPGATGVTFTPSVSGDYAVMVTQGSCVETSECENITIVGLDKPIRRDVTIFPNPVKDLINMETDANILGATFRIYDTQGMEVATGRIATNTPEVRIGDLPDGIYLMKIESDDEILSVRFVKS
jgi:NAD-dependent dihydropyrimidine dehydrogenase PreA subunit